MNEIRVIYLATCQTRFPVPSPILGEYTDITSVTLPQNLQIVCTNADTCAFNTDILRSSEISSIIIALVFHDGKQIDRIMQNHGDSTKSLRVR